MLTRRHFLQSALATAAASQLPPQTLPSLKAIARSRGLRFGADSDTSFATAPTAYSTIFTQQCELLAPLMSWSRTNPTPDAPFVDDPNIPFARANNLQLTGGHILWYKRTPDWLTPLTNAQIEQAIDARIDQLAARYKGMLYSWNVVNEALDDHADTMRPSLFQDRFGLDYFHFTAVKAQQAAPHVVRVYNDYGFESDTPTTAAKRKRLLDLLDTFVKNKTPIDAIGLQSHIRLGAQYPYDPAVTAAFLKEISSRGFKIFITELDVFDFDTPSDIATRDRMVADRYRLYLDTCLANPAVTTVVTWGLCDKYTWLTPAYNPKYARADNSPSRPLLFDADLNPKPSFNAVAEALRHAPKR
jgi:endo-1,4-beta-xylanase